MQELRCANGEPVPLCLMLSLHGYMVGEIQSVRWVVTEGALELGGDAYGPLSAEELALVGGDIEVNVIDAGPGHRLWVDARLVSLSQQGGRLTVSLDRLSNLRDDGLLERLAAPSAPPPLG